MLSFTDGRELRTQEKVRKSNHGEASKTDQNLLVQRRKNIKTDHISFRTPSNLSLFSNKGKGSTTIHIKTKQNNVEKNQNEVAETLDSDFKNAALNIGDHVCRLTEDDHSEHDSVRSIREVYEENDLDFKLLAPNEVQRALETSIQRNLVVGIPRSHRSFLRAWLTERPFSLHYAMIIIIV